MTSPEKIDNILSDKKVLRLYKKGKLFMTKKWLTSRTLWLGVLGIITGVTMAVEQQLLAGGSITVMSVLMIIMRVITTSKLVK